MLLPHGCVWSLRWFSKARHGVPSCILVILLGRCLLSVPGFCMQGPFRSVCLCYSQIQSAIFTTSYIYIYMYAALGLSPSLPLWERCHLQDFADRGCSYTPLSVASLVAQSVKNLPATQETWAWSLGQEEPLEKEMATHSSILARRIPSHGQSSLAGYSLWGHKSQTCWVTKPPPPPLSADLLGKWEPRFTPSEAHPLTPLSSWVYTFRKTGPKDLMARKNGACYLLDRKKKMGTCRERIKAEI